jgi:8-amino-7-oxononanoate synthase
MQVLSSFAKEIFSDERNHASLIDGIRLSGLPKEIVPPQNWTKLNSKEGSLFVMESLYGMDGGFGPLNEFDRFLTEKQSFLWVDEAHAAGIFGEGGKGLWQPEAWDFTAKLVTFGKAFGVSGAAILCSKRLKELLLSLGRGFIFTTAPPPSVAAMVRESLRIVKREPERMVELHERALMVRTLWETEIGLEKKVGVERMSPLITLSMPGKDKALRFAENMRESGIDLRAIRYPTVPEGKERIRVSLNLRVSLENTMAMAEEVVRKWTEFS